MAVVTTLSSVGWLDSLACLLTEIFFKHTPKLIMFGTHNLQTFKHNNILFNKLLLMQFYLINIRPKLHRQNWRKLRVTLPVNMSIVLNFLNFTINAVLRPTFCPETVINCRGCNLYIHTYFWSKFCLLYWTASVAAFAWYSINIGVVFGVQFERRKVIKKQTYMKTETCKLYSRVFWIFILNCIKSDP